MKWHWRRWMSDQDEFLNQTERGPIGPFLFPVELRASSDRTNKLLEGRYIAAIGVDPDRPDELRLLPCDRPRIPHQNENGTWLGSYVRKFTRRIWPNYAK